MISLKQPDLLHRSDFDVEPKTSWYTVILVNNNQSIPVLVVCEMKLP